MERRIIWTKWVNPLINNNDMDSEGTADNNTIKESFPVMMTPMGIVPLPLAEGEQLFNMWVGHTNFNLTASVVRIIEETEGVEALDICTRYRFRVAFGKIFDEDTVKINIENNLNCIDEEEKLNQVQNLILNKELQRQVDTLVEMFEEKQYKYWYIFVLPNGKISYSIHDDKESAQKKETFYKYIRYYVGGAFFQSEDKNERAKKNNVY